MRPQAPLLVIALSAASLFVAACQTTPPPPEGLVMEKAEATDDFVVGQTYQSNQPLFLIQHGERHSLVTTKPTLPTQQAGAEIQAVLEPDATITVDHLMSEDTLTHGIDSWPVGQIQSGDFAGIEVGLGQDLLEHCFEKIEDSSPSP